eukprot:GHVS01028135.1.p1 GENE.GHVS01028135.1~~GHVS01028135.1.p1  ORF type:complete len:293 (-),score=30.12 GHVS01028135.1:227-1105(-)
MSQSAPEEAYSSFDRIAAKHVDVLRRLTKQIQEARKRRDNITVKEHMNEFENALGKYIPVLMGQAKIHWDTTNYAMVERIFRQSAEFCSDNESWKLNVGHVFFMQEKYKECIRYYQPFVSKHAGNLLGVTAIVLANLCVAYIMTSANEEAEDLMREIEKEEEAAQLQDPKKQVYHLCIVNLVIGTLYCAKGNFEFGISRVIKSLEPYNRKLGIDTWFYSKRCFLALAETLAKHMMLIKDEPFNEVLDFLDAAVQHGKHIPTAITPLGERNGQGTTVSVEARLLKRLLLSFRD